MTYMVESALPLAGLRVLDISSFIAAPAAAVVPLAGAAPARYFTTRFFLPPMN